jgi:UDP:flavonoid glycosyltransferase YjiC (YdhE family)
MSEAMRFVIMPLGSAGDVHPMVWIGKRLAERGHEVIMLVEEALIDIAKRAGLETISLGKKEEQQEVLKNPDLWHPRKAFKVVAKFLPQYIREPLKILERYKDDQRTVVVTGSLAFAGRVAAELWGMPHVVVHLQPSIFMSVEQTPVMVAGSEILTKMPRFVRKGLMWFVDRTVDKEIGPAVNGIRAEVGLTTPVKGIMRTYWHGPDGVIALFPDWYARKVSDWPQQTVVTRFPLYDESEEKPIAPEVEAFLAVGGAGGAGEKPILFTPGSANAHGRMFFEQGAEALKRMGKRGIFLTRFLDQVPAGLPETIKAFEYVPFSQVFPRCAAVVHHGGIGTCAQAMAAGVPQLLMPMAHDQPDNGSRLRHLGIGDYLYPKKFKPKAIAEKLAHLTTAREVASACKGVKEMIRTQMSAAAFCAVLERMGEQAFAKRTAARGQSDPAGEMMVATPE